MAGPKNMGNENSTQEMALLSAAVLAAIAGAVIWYFYRAPLVYFILGLNWVEVEIVSLMHGGLGQVGARVMSFMTAVFTAHKEASLVKGSELAFVMDAVGYQVRFYIIAIILALAVWCLFRMRGEGMKMAFNLTSLAAYQAGYWKVALAGSRFDPSDPDQNRQPALKPMEWIIREKLPLTRGRDGHGDLDETATAAALAAQLGDTYVGLKKMSIHAQAVAVAFNLSRLRDRRVQELKEKLTEIWVLSSREEAEKKTAELIAPYLADQKFLSSTEKILGRHAFVNTALMGLFEAAKKEGGVFSTSEILWLKPVDRTLWYGLQNVGRHAYYIEGAGIRAHYFAERVSGEQKVEPYVVEAIYGLRDYLIKHGIVDLKEYLDSQKPVE